jgi:uncharacterized protein (AIM24 family)
MNIEKTDYPFNIAAAPDYGIVNITIPAGKTLKAEASAMAYMDSSIKIKAKLGGGFKRMLSGEKLFVNEFTALESDADIDVKDNYVVDTGYIVGFTEGLTYDVRPVGGLKSIFFSGEGLVCRFSGEGKIWIQTRLSLSFVTWADGFREIEKKKN